MKKRQNQSSKTPRSKRKLSNITGKTTLPSSKEVKVEECKSPLEKLENDLLAKIFSWFDFKTNNPLAAVCDFYKIKDNMVQKHDRYSDDWVTPLKQQNKLRLTNKRFLGIIDSEYKKKLNQLLECSYVRSENDLRTYRQIYFDMENKIKNYAMSLYTQITLWKEWSSKFLSTGNKYIHEEPCLKIIGDFLISFSPDVKRCVVLKYLFNDKLPKHPCDEIIFFKPLHIDTTIYAATTLLEWMSAIGDRASVEFLLSKGAYGNLNESFSDNNPLYYALSGTMWGSGYNRVCAKNKPERIYIVNKLIEAGANIHANRDNNCELSLFAETLLHPACSEETIKLYLDRYFPEDKKVEFNPIQQILLLLRCYKKDILKDKPYIFANCIKAFNYLADQKTFFQWFCRFDKDTEVQCKSRDKIDFDDELKDKGRYYRKALDYLIFCKKGLQGYHETPNAFYYTIKENKLLKSI